MDSAIFISPSRFAILIAGVDWAACPVKHAEGEDAMRSQQLRELHQVVEQAIAALPQKNIAKQGGNEFELRALFPVSSWKPHTDSTGEREMLVAGEDSCGNRFLYSHDGSVLFWDHETEEEKLLATGMTEFLASLSAPTPIKLDPGQVKRAWIDPAFLEEQNRKGTC